MLRSDKNNIRIAYAGAISHPQNRAICNRLGLYDRMISMSKLREGDLKNSSIILVDSSVTNDGRCPQGFCVDPLIVVDHHRGGNVTDGDNKFVLIQDVGAASTLVYELFKGCGIKFEEVDESIPLLLAVGIHTDTNNLVSCSMRDVCAYGELLSVIKNHQELVSIFNYPLQASNYENMDRALKNMSQQGAHLVTNIGAIQAKDGDDLSTIADYLIRRDGVSLVIVWAMILDEKRVRISARSTDTSLELGSFLRERFGASCGGKFTPDGKSVGGGTMDLDFGFWLKPGTTQKAVEFVDAFMKDTIFS